MNKIDLKEILAKHSNDYKFMLESGRENGPGKAVIDSSIVLTAMQEVFNIAVDGCVKASKLEMVVSKNASEPYLRTNKKAIEQVKQLIL